MYMTIIEAKRRYPWTQPPPTVSTKSVLITATIDAHERRDVGICNILCVFLSADMDEDVKMALRGRLA